MQIVRINTTCSQLGLVIETPAPLSPEGQQATTAAIAAELQRVGVECNIAYTRGLAGVVTAEEKMISERGKLAIVMMGNDNNDLEIKEKIRQGVAAELYARPEEIAVLIATACSIYIYSEVEAPMQAVSFELYRG